MSFIVVLALVLDITAYVKINRLADMTVKMYVYSMPAGQTARDVLESARIVKQQLLTVVSVLLLLISGTSICVAILIARHIIRPICGIRQVIRQITAGNIDHRINPQRSDELGELARAFDEMMDDLSRGPLEPVECQESPPPLAPCLPAVLNETDEAIESLFAKSCQTLQTVSEDIASLTALYAPGLVTITDIINWEGLVEGLGDEDTIRELVPPCLNDMHAHIAELAQALVCEDYRSIVFHVHAIKGAGRYLSIERVTHLATRMECAAQENDMLACVEYFNDLKPEIEKVLVVLSQDNWIERVKIEQAALPGSGS